MDALERGLWDAIMANDPSALRTRLMAGADSQDDLWYTFEHCILKKKLGCAQAILQYYPEFITDYTAFVMAMHSMDPEIIEWVLTKYPQFVKERQDGDAPQMLVSTYKENAAQILQLLINHGLDVNYATNKSKRNLLFYATRADVMRVLISAGADIHQRDKHNNIPLVHILENADYYISNHYPMTEVQKCVAILAAAHAAAGDNLEEILESQNLSTTTIESLVIPFIMEDLSLHLRIKEKTLIDWLLTVREDYDALPEPLIQKVYANLRDEAWERRRSAVIAWLERRRPTNT